MVGGRKTMMRSSSKNDMIFTIIVYLIASLALIMVFYPLYFVVIASFSKPSLVSSGSVWFYPKGFTLKAYEMTLMEPRIWLGYRNTIFYTTVGTFINLLVTLPAAYALSKKEFMIRNQVMFFFTLTMFFSGGLIPTYLLIKNLWLHLNR